MEILFIDFLLIAIGWFVLIVSFNIIALDARKDSR